MQTLTSVLKYFGIFHISWCKNARANTLSQLVTLVDSTHGQTYIEFLKIPSTKEAEKIQQVNHKPS